MFPRPIPRPLPLAATERWERKDKARSVQSANAHAMEQPEPLDSGTGRDLKGHLVQHHAHPMAFPHCMGTCGWHQSWSAFQNSCLPVQHRSHREAGSQVLRAKVVWGASLRTREKMNSQRWPMVS